MQTSQLPIIVILSNNPYICHFFRENLQDQFFVMDFSSQERTVDCVKMLYTAAVIIDQKISEDVLPLCQEIHNEKRSKKAPIFLLTNELKHSYLQKAALSGVSEFLSLPLSIDEFIEKMELFEKKQTTETKSNLLKEKIPFAEEPAASLKHAFFHETQLPNQPGYILYIVLEESFNNYSSFLKNHLRNFDEILLEENDRIVLFLAKTSDRAAFSIAEIIQIESPIATTIGGIPILKWDENTLTEAKEKGEEITKLAKEQNQKIIFA